MACFENFDRYPLIRSRRMHAYGAIRRDMKSEQELQVILVNAGESAVEQRMLVTNRDLLCRRPQLLVG